MTNADTTLSTYRAAASLATGLVRTLGDDQRHLPTPCPELDVEALVGHLTGAVRRSTLAAKGVDLSDMPLDASLDPTRPLAEQFEEAVAASVAAWEAADLDAKVVLPWATMTARDTAEIYTIELCAHAWDLAVASGQTARLDPRLGEAALERVLRQVPEHDYRGPDMPFADVVPTAPEADAWTRFAAWTGRSA